jgi:hypothetical protein
MKISFESKGDFNAITDWLKDVTHRDPASAISAIAREGTRSLAENTPRSTGETASSWKEKITTKGGITEISWYNTAHPGSMVNIAKLIDLGHGTGTGGYVPPRPYIKDAMKPVWSHVDNRVVRELIK